MKQTYSPGEPVIYRKTKHSVQPGVRAKNVAPSRHGNDYSYTVDKFWTVVRPLDDNRILVQTRRGKRHVIHADDPNLHPASWWDLIVRRSRFPSLGTEH